MNFYNSYILVTFGIKILYFLCAFAIIILSKYQSNDNIVKTLKFWQHRLDFIFAVLLSFLLVYIFFPLRTEQFHLDTETKLLFFAYGIIVLLNADWSIFFTESPMLKTLQMRDL